MKKLYSTVALAALVSGSAAAGVVGQKEQASFNSQVDLQEMSAVMPEAKGQKALNVTKADDLLGYYFYDFSSGFDSNDHIKTAYIAKGEGENDLLIYGLCDADDKAIGEFGVPVKATFSQSNGKYILTIPSQIVYEEMDGGQLFQIEAMAVDMKTSSRVPALVMTVCPNGVTYSDGTNGYSDGCIAALSSIGLWGGDDESLAAQQGYFINYNMILAKVADYGTAEQQPFVFNAADWTSCGNGTFKQGFMNTEELFGSSINPYQVEVLMSNNDENHFLIKNPYNASTPFGDVNADANGEGYIYINASNKDCVLVKPVVYSGYNDQSLWPFGQLFFSNAEGYNYYLNEYSYDDILDELDWYGDPVSTMTVDADNNATINIENPLVANICDFVSYGALKFGSSGYVSGVPSTLTFKIDNSAVKGVEFDAEAPVKYFNLQGVEIAAPVKGQLVIKTQGGKSVKTIAE